MSTHRIFYLVVKAMLIVAITTWVDSNSKGIFAQESSVIGSGAVRASKTQSKDVYPESGFRLPLPKRDDMDYYGKKVYDKIVGPGGRTLAGLRGPSGIRLHSPKMAEHANGLNQYLRFESGLNGRIRELAILVTAREMDSQFEWTAHEPVALKEGLLQEVIDVVKYRKNIAELTEIESVIIQLGREMFGQRK